MSTQQQMPYLSRPVYLLNDPAYCSDKAQTLRDQLIMWQTPPEPTWPARQQHLSWLDIASANVKEIFSSLRHGPHPGTLDLC